MDTHTRRSRGLRADWYWAALSKGKGDEDVKSDSPAGRRDEAAREAPNWERRRRVAIERR